MGREVETVEDVVAQMCLLLKAIPPRPSVSQVDVAKQAIREEESALSAKLDELFSQPCPPAVPPRIFRALQEMHESVIRTQSEVKRKNPLFILQLEEKHQIFYELIRKAESALPAIKSSAPPPDASGLLARTQEEGRNLFDDEGSVKAGTLVTGSSKEDGEALLNTEGVVQLSAEEEELLGARWPANLLSILDAAEKEGKQPEALDFSNGAYTWIPESIGILTNLTALNLSGNQLQALPESVGLLTNLTSLDVEANLLKSLPESLGLLTNLQTLNIEKNSIEELPWTIGKCTSLVELRADFNQLKALPEALGQLRSLRILSVHLNCLKTLPTTMSSLTSLTELYVHFNHLDTLPENLCSLTSLQKLDASSNFADFRTLPQSIGKLQGLRELDLSFNHLSVLPDSFVQLTNLRRLKLEGNPWRIPPLEVVAEGQLAILEFMVKYKEKEEQEKLKASGSWNILAVVLNFLRKCTKPKADEDEFSKITA